MINPRTLQIAAFIPVDMIPGGLITLGVSIRSIPALLMDLSGQRIVFRTHVEIFPFYLVKKWSIIFLI